MKNILTEGLFMKKKFDARAVAAASALVSMGLSLPMQEGLLDIVNNEISEIKEELVKSGKSPDDIKTLFDTLEKLTIKKYHTENRIAQLKRIIDVKNAHDKSSNEIVLKEDDRTLKEIIEKD